MKNTMHSIGNFLDQNLYGFLLLLIAAYFYKTGEVQGATAFFGAGSALIGVKKPQAQAETTTTLSTDTPSSATVTTGPS